MEVIYVKCCQVWPVVVGVNWGRCGKCGKRPDRMATPEEVVERIATHGPTTRRTT